MACLRHLTATRSHVPLDLCLFCLALPSLPLIRSIAHSQPTDSPQLEASRPVSGKQPRLPVTPKPPELIAASSCRGVVTEVRAFSGSPPSCFNSRLGMDTKSTFIGVFRPLCTKRRALPRLQSLNYPRRSPNHPRGWQAKVRSYIVTKYILTSTSTRYPQLAPL
jgi:hypothetical protein